MGRRPYGAAIVLVTVIACGRLGFETGSETRRDGGDVPGDSAQTLVCPNGYVELAGLPNRYRALGEQLFLDASAMCSEDGMPLAVVDTDAEAAALLAAGGGSAWAGVVGTGNGGWETITGLPASYLPWGPGQPMLTGTGSIVYLSTEPQFRSDGTVGSLYRSFCECGPRKM